MKTHRLSRIAPLVLLASLAGAGCTATASPNSDRAASDAAPRLGDSAADGPWLMYGRDTLYLSRTDGSDEHPLLVEPVEGGGAILHADWSPDGATVAFEVQSDDVSVWTVDADGTSPQQRVACLQAPCLQIAEPVWSPDGRSLLVVQYDEGPDGTWGPSWLVDVDLTTGERNIIARTGSKSAFYFPRWSSDGSRVVVEVDRYTDSSQSEVTGTVIGVVRADLSGPQPVQVLTRPRMLANHPDWHPSRNLLVFSTNDPILFPVSTQPSNVFLMRPDGKGLRQLSTQSTDGRLRLGQTTWAPDGRSVVLIAARASTDVGVVETKHPAFLSLNQGALSVLANRGADPRMQP